MLDWFVILTPLLLLPIALLFLFVGCKPFGTAESPQPPPQPAPGPGPTPPPPPPPALLQLNPAANLNVIVPNGAEQKVEAIKVTWTLTKKGGGPAPKPLPAQTLKPADPSRPFIEPGLDGYVERKVADADVATYDQVTCRCDVALRPTDLTDPNRQTFPTNPVVADLKPNKNHVFRLLPDWDKPKKTPRVFTVVQDF